MKKRLFCLVNLLLALCIAVSIAACSSGGGFNITVEGDYGRITERRQADAGEKIFVRSALEGYDLAEVYLNGSKLEGDSFIMPQEDVVLTYRLSATGKDVHSIVMQPSDGGEVVCDLLSASSGDTVYLRSVPFYNSKLSYYTVNGEKIAGNSFAMPNEEVSVSAVFTRPITDTNIVLEATTNYQKAKSYWYASYHESGISVRAVVEDNIVYTVEEYLNGFAYADNIEFILGLAGEKGTYSSHSRRVLVSAKGDYLFQKYSGGWLTAAENGFTAESRQCDIDTYGFVGYEVEVYVPYTALGLTYAQAYGNLTLAPAMRNTLSALSTTWVYYREMDCNWENVGTHPLVKEDGSITKNITQTEYIFAGEGLLSQEKWSAFGSDMKSLGDVITIAKGGTDIGYWAENVTALTERAPKEVIFYGGASDIASGSVLKAFSAMRDFIGRFTEAGADCGLKIISALPTISPSCDPEAIKAFNDMVRAYTETLDNVAYIDLFGEIYAGGKINRCMYSGPSDLSYEGYKLLKRVILREYGAYTETENEEWGSCGQFVSVGAWSFSGNGVSLNGGGTSLLYRKTALAEDFVYEAEFTAKTLYNNDAYPKFGLLLANANTSRFFYVCAENGLTCNDVGIVKKSYNDFEWDDSEEYPVAGMTYTDGDFVKLKLVKRGGEIEFYANDAYIASISAEEFGGEPIVLGIFSFNLGLDIRNVYAAEE